MSVFRTAMVWLGLVDDDEYYGEDDQYYLDDEYDDARRRRARGRAPRVARPARPSTETSPLTVIRSRHARAEAEAPVATVPARRRRSSRSRCRPPACTSWIPGASTTRRRSATA